MRVQETAGTIGDNIVNILGIALSVRTNARPLSWQLSPHVLLADVDRSGEYAVVRKLWVGHHGE
jgi:hypothetical protein